MEKGSAEMLEEQQGKMKIQKRIEINCESRESEGETRWRRTRRKVLMLGILFSSNRSRRAFSWLLQYSPYTENLSLCTTRNKKWPVSLSEEEEEEEE